MMYVYPLFHGRGLTHSGNVLSHLGMPRLGFLIEFPSIIGEYEALSFPKFLSYWGFKGLVFEGPWIGCRSWLRTGERFLITIRGNTYPRPAPSRGHRIPGLLREVVGLERFGSSTACCGRIQPTWEKWQLQDSCNRQSLTKTYVKRSLFCKEKRINPNCLRFQRTLMSTRDFVPGSESTIRTEAPGRLSLQAFVHKGQGPCSKQMRCTTPHRLLINPTHGVG